MLFHLLYLGVPEQVIKTNLILLSKLLEASNNLFTGLD